MLRRLATALLLLAGSTPALALPTGSGASDPSVVIGVVATLTGPGSIAGQDTVDGINLALKQLGGRFSNQEVRVVVTDDKGSPDVARQQLHRLLERERLDVVLAAGSAPSLAAMLPALDDRRLFLFTLGQVPPEVGGPQCSPWLFNIEAPPDGVHEALGQYLAAEKARRVVVVGPAGAMTANAVAAFKHTFPGEVVAVLNPKPGATTYAPEIEAIAKAKPDAIYSLLTGGMGAAFVRAWGSSTLKGEVPLYPLWSTVERQFLPSMGEVQDLPSIGTWSADVDTPANKRMVTDFEVEYGRPASTWVAQGYDAVFLLDGALKATNGKTVNPDAVRNALRRADFVSTRGSFKFSTNHMP
ncbi:MAG TPA: ABC transporter substrate-binding protein, partial [Magnetospirillum sp.]|nr:ABC transporter substrate-binding protein [Magnetospirillum sp.]